MKNTTSRYITTNATLIEQVKRRKSMKEWMQTPIARGINGEIPYAIVYGVAEQNGIVKLFKKCPVFYNSNGFENYVKKHKQIVQAVYSHA